MQNNTSIVFIYKQCPNPKGSYRVYSSSSNFSKLYLMTMSLFCLVSNVSSDLNVYHSLNKQCLSKNIIVIEQNDLITSPQNNFWVHISPWTVCRWKTTVRHWHCRTGLWLSTTAILPTRPTLLSNGTAGRTGNSSETKGKQSRSSRKWNDDGEKNLTIYRGLRARTWPTNLSSFHGRSRSSLITRILIPSVSRA